MRQHLAYAAGAAVLALTGCGGDEPTPQIADPTPTPSASSSPSESAVAEKEPWERKSDDGAVAFVEHWLDTFNQMQTSGSTDDFIAIATSDCQACREFVRITEQIDSEGGTLQTTGWSSRDIAVGAASTASAKELAVRLSQAAETIRYDDGREPTKYPGGKVTVLMTVVWQHGAWRMEEVAFP